MGRGSLLLRVVLVGALALLMSTVGAIPPPAAAATAGTLVLSPPLQTLVVGTNANLVATVRDPAGVPIADVPVTFSRTGAHQNCCVTMTTNASGQVAYVYTGVNPGQDVVQAVVEDSRNLSAVAVVTWGELSGYPSTDCGPGGTPIFDGYVERNYLRLRTKGAGSSTWVCFAELVGGTYVGGKVIVDAAISGVPSVTNDGSSDACDANPATQILNEPGQIGPVPFDLDINQFPSGVVWVCVDLNDGMVKQRIVVTPSIPSLGTTAIVFDQGAPASFPEPVSPGSASGTCQQLGLFRLANADIGPAPGHVWAYTRQESSRTHVCLRAESAAGSFGGRLTIDAGGGQTIVSTDANPDFSVCDTNIITLGTPPLSLKFHAGTTPAWLCLQVGSSYTRIRIDTSGGQGIVTFTPDS